MEAQPIKIISLPIQIVKSLRKEIMTGKYQPNDLFPSERELAQHFGASRGTLRKALAILAEEGWISISQGRGNLVNDYLQNIGFDLFPTLFFDLPDEIVTPEGIDSYLDYAFWVYSRIMIEAARKATPADEQRLKGFLNDLIESRGSEHLLDNNNRIINELLKISGNLVTRMMYNNLNKMLRKIIEVSDFPGDPFIDENSQYIIVHRAFIKAICANNEARVQTILDKIETDSKELFRILMFNIVNELKDRQR